MENIKRIVFNSQRDRNEYFSLGEIKDLLRKLPHTDIDKFRGRLFSNRCVLINNEMLHKYSNVLDACIYSNKT